MSVDAKIKELNLTLPEPASAAGNYVPYVKTGNLLYLSGTLPMLEGKITHSGKVGKEHTIETGYEAAKTCALNALTNIQAALGGLDKVKRVVCINGFVNGIEGFSESPAVINGASDLFVAVFGDAGRHSRAAVSVSGLPKNAVVEIQCVVEF